MTFWAIVLGFIGVVLFVAWRYDQRRRGQTRVDIWQRTDAATGVNMFKGQDAEQGATRGLYQFPLS